MLEKLEILNLLDQANIEYELHEHVAVYTMDEMLQLELPKLDSVAKNLFVRDDKKQNYYILVLKGNQSVRLKEIKEKIKSRPLSFGSEADLEKYLKLAKGSVTPFGVLNDNSKKVKIYIDQHFKGSQIAVHPNTSTATVWLKADDLVSLLLNEEYDASYISL